MKGPPSVNPARLSGDIGAFIRMWRQTLPQTVVDDLVIAPVFSDEPNFGA
jgi:hypothetical protein